jgi:hypothetical protein
METFTIGFGGLWWLRALSRNPLVRRSDRIEAAVRILAVVVAVVAVPIAAAVGTSVHDARARLYAEEAQSRHQVVATATDDGAIVPEGKTIVFVADTAWSDGGKTHSGVVEWSGRQAEVGDHQTIWVNNEGEFVGPPPPSSRADAEGVTAALAVWVGVAGTLATLAYVVRRRLDHWRYAEWDREIGSARGNYGRSNPQS